MPVDINGAEQEILKILPKATLLQGIINTKGTFLLFDSLRIKELSVGDIDYIFQLYISISSHGNNNSLAYDGISSSLNALFSDFDRNRKIDIGKIQPHAIKGLIVYQIELTVKGFKDVQFD